MADPVESSDLPSNRGAAPSDQWLGGEAFLGDHYQPPEDSRRPRVWSRGEMLVACLGALTLGTALGILLSPSKK